jgi:hypothetical protein
MLHHVAPVAGGISDGQKNRLVFSFCSFKGFFIPGIPIYRVCGMLQQIRAGFVYQAIVFGFSIRW